MKLTENRVANPAGVYDPANANHVKGAARVQPIVNNAAKRRSKGVSPGRASLMSPEEYQRTSYAKDIKKDSPDRPYR